MQSNFSFRQKPRVSFSSLQSWTWLNQANETLLEWPIWQSYKYVSSAERAQRLDNGDARVRMQESSDDGAKPAFDDIVMLVSAWSFAKRRSPNLSAQRDLHFWNSTRG